MNKLGEIYSVFNLSTLLNQQQWHNPAEFLWDIVRTRKVGETFFSYHKVLSFTSNESVMAHITLNRDVQVLEYTSIFLAGIFLSMWMDFQAGASSPFLKGGYLFKWMVLGGLLH